MLRKKRLGVLFVCANNICRSPLAEAVFRAAAERERLRALVIDSAGTSAAFAGQRPDVRAVRAAQRRGYELSRTRARQVTAKDFLRFEWIFAMDEANLRALSALRPEAFAGRLGLLMDVMPGAPQREVPDPYFGASESFERALDLIEPACRALAARIAESRRAQPA